MGKLKDALYQLIKIGNLTINEGEKVDIYDLLEDARDKGVISKEDFLYIVDSFQRSLEA